MRSRNLGAELRPQKTWVSATGKPPTPPSSRSAGPSGAGRRETKKMRGRGRRGARRQPAQTLAKSLEIPKRLWKVSGRKCSSHNPNRGRAISSLFPATLGQLCSGDPVQGGQGGPGGLSLPRPNLVPAETYLLTQPWPCPRLQSEHGTRQPALETGSSTLPQNLTRPGERGDLVCWGLGRGEGRCAQI